MRIAAAQGVRALLIPRDAALQTRINAPGSGIPQLLVCLDERLDFSLRELEPLLAQRGERLERLPNKPETQLFVGEQLADERAVFIAALGFVTLRQVKAAIAVYASFHPSPEAVTTIVARQERWPATLGAIGTVGAVRGVTVSADLPGIVEKIAFDSGKTVTEGDVLVQLDRREEQAQLTAAEAQRDLAHINLERMLSLCGPAENGV